MTFSVIDANAILQGKNERFKRCFFCNIAFTVKDFDDAKVSRHHQHYPPFNFEGFSHAFCNIRAKISRRFPVIIFNSSHYDTKFILQVLGKFKNEKVFCIPKSSEQFISVCIGPIQIIDAISFFKSSLDEAAARLYDNGVGSNNFNIVENEFRNELEKTSVVSNDLFGKGLFPYNLLSSYKDFAITEFNNPEFYYNDLKEIPVNLLQLEKAIKLWEKLNIKTLGDLCAFYVRLDCSLLSATFFNLRKTLYLEHGLDVSQFCSLSAFAYQACLKSTGAQIENLQNYEMYNFILRAKRGGVCQNSRKYSKANNKCLPDFNPNLPTSFLGAFDVNGLYGLCLSRRLGVGSYKFIVGDELNKLTNGNFCNFIFNFNLEQDHSFLCEIDMEFPPEIHDSLKEWVPVCENRCVEEEELSSYQLDLKQKLGFGNMIYKQQRLISDLHPKTCYVAHIGNAQLYLKLGIKITKLHRMLYYKQKPWAQKYIERMSL